MQDLREYHGSCHCGAVEFTVRVPDAVDLENCNCSICHKSGYLHLIVPASRFTLLKGREALSCYRYGTGVAQHFFCRTCGIKPYYVPRSNPDGIDVNAHCLDGMPPQVRIVDFDGRNWEKNAHLLAHKSVEP